MNEYNGPLLWDKLLKTVRETAYPKAVVAGGCVRDWFHDQSLVPNDIDIFVGVADELEFDIAFHGLPFADKRQMTSNENGNRYTAADTQEFAANILGGVIEAYTDDSRQKINIVGKRIAAIDDVGIELISDFDHSLCEFWWDGERVCRSQDAYASFTTKTITINPHAVGKTRTIQRLASLTRRNAYRDYKYDGKIDTLTYTPVGLNYATYALANENWNVNGPGARIRLVNPAAEIPQWNIAQRRWENINILGN